VGSNINLSTYLFF